MKRIVLSFVLVISVLLIISCQTTGRNYDDAFRRIYERYSSDLILDNATRYTVRSGDILARIADSLYGDGYYYPVIMLASKDVVQDPDKIQPGMVLIIPDLQRNLNNERSRAAIKGVINDCAAIESSRGRTETAAGLRAHANRL